MIRPNGGRLFCKPANLRSYTPSLAVGKENRLPFQRTPKRSLRVCEPRATSLFLRALESHQKIQKGIVI